MKRVEDFLFRFIHKLRDKSFMLVVMLALSLITAVLYFSITPTTGASVTGFSVFNGNAINTKLVIFGLILIAVAVIVFKRRR